LSTKFKTSLKILETYVKHRHYTPRYKTRAQLKAYQNRKLLIHIAWAMENSLFYKKYFQRFSRNPLDLLQMWEQIPPINKQVMMENFDTLNTKGLKQEEVFSHTLKAEVAREKAAKLNGSIVGLSTGTSGRRGIFVVSDEEHAAYVGYVLARVRQNSIFRKNRVAVFLRSDNLLYQAPVSSHFQYLFFNTFDDPSSWKESLQSFNPTVIIAPPTVLAVLGEMLKAQKLSVRPNEIVSVGEVLEPESRAELEQIFGLMVHQYYQCTEGILGLSCLEGKIHLSEDIIRFDREIVQVADIKHGRAFIPILSDFTRKSLPLLRYRLDDILILSEKPCSCGSPFLALERIVGREADLFYFLDFKNMHKPIFGDVLVRIATRCGFELRVLKIEQTTLNSLLVSVENLLSESQKLEITQLWRQYFDERNLVFPKIDWEMNQNRQSHLTKKYRRIVSSLSLGQDAQIE